MKNIAALLIFIFLQATFTTVLSQQCSAPGTVPSSAIPVCGTTPFIQPTISLCTGPPVATKGCGGTVVSSSRSYWYKFTCFQSGSFGFEIRGVNPSVDDDYDWVLYDITGLDPNEVFSTASIQVSLNIYGVSNSNAPYPNLPTGTRPGATGDIHCAGSAS